MKKLIICIFLAFIFLNGVMGQTAIDTNVAQTPKAFIGVNVGAGYLYSPRYQAVNGCGGLDFAFSASSKFAAGFYVSYYSINTVAIGPLFMVGNLNRTSFLIGFGPNVSFDRNISNLKEGDIMYDRHFSTSIGANLKMGCRHNGFYWFLDFRISQMKLEDQAGSAVYRWNGLAYGGSLNVGWMFGVKNNKK